MSNLVLLFVAAVVLWTAFTFNRLVHLRNQVQSAWADIDVQLRRRHDLVPRLVTTVKAYAEHERVTLEAVSELRARAAGTNSPRELGKVESALEQGLGRLLALREAYPELKASESFEVLQQELVEIEDHLQYARRFYNGAVRDLNTRAQRIPDFVVARAFGFQEEEFFQAEAGERGAVRVDLGS